MIATVALVALLATGCGSGPSTGEIEGSVRAGSGVLGTTFSHLDDQQLVCMAGVLHDSGVSAELLVAVVEHDMTFVGSTDDVQATVAMKPDFDACRTDVTPLRAPCCTRASAQPLITHAAASAPADGIRNRRQPIA